MEHPQEMINKDQYGEYYPDFLPAAPYKLTANLKNGRGVYTFCMCPGGYVVNASSEPHRLAVNGMSYSKRDGQNANTAVIVTVTPEDFGSSHPLAGVEFQRKLEENAYREGNGKVPVQLFGDFCKNIPSQKLGNIIPQIKGMYQLANVRRIFPEIIADSLQEGVCIFDQKLPGYARKDAVISGVESRTSSPVRIIRDDSLQSEIRRNLSLWRRRGLCRRHYICSHGWNKNCRNDCRHISPVRDKKNKNFFMKYAHFM